MASPHSKLTSWLIGIAARFSQCDVCYQCKKEIQKALSMEVKLGAVLRYRQHLSDVYSDRCHCWALQELSGEGDCVVIMSDGMDQSKFALPRDPGLRATAFAAKLRKNRPRVTIHGIWICGHLDFDQYVFLFSEGMQKWLGSHKSFPVKV